jgi:hypothetical protein
MRRVTTEVLCNFCLDPISVTEVDEAEWTISFGPSTGQPVQGRFDLCSDCATTWTKDIAVLLKDGLPYKRPKPVVTGKGKVIQPEPEPVLFTCSCGNQYGTDRGLSMHMTRMGHQEEAS